MKLCYQVATPDIRKSAAVTSYQADLEEAFSKLSDMGYDGVELMVRNPRELHKEKIKSLANQYHLDIVMICTGEVFGQEKLTLVNRYPNIRMQAFERTKELIDFAAFMGADINIGRLRGNYYDDIPRQETYDLAVQVMKELAQYAKEKNVTIVIEPITMLQTNFINSTQEGIAFVKEVDHDNFKVMIDLYHANIEDKNIYESIRESRDYLCHVHVADNNRRILGTCGFNFVKILEVLRDIDYDKAISLEMFQIPDQETAARESYEFIRPLIDSMKEV